MKYNLNFIDVMVRYALLMFFGILGGVLGSIPLMLVGLLFFFAAILGWCPVYYILGIDHHKGGMLSNPDEKEGCRH